MNSDATAITLLVIDHDISNVELVRKLLGGSKVREYTIESAESLTAGIEKSMCGGVNLIFLNLELPDSSGIDTLVSFTSQIPDLPIVILSPQFDTAMGSLALQAGAQDFLEIATMDEYTLEKSIHLAFMRKELFREIDTAKAEAQAAAWNEYETKEQLEREVEMRKAAELKLHDTIELLSQTNKSLEDKNNEMNILNKQLEKKEQLLTEVNKKLEVLAATDPLTGLLNRRAGYACLNQEISRVNRGIQQLGLIMFDLDHFKRFNDNFGHEVGDTVLLRIAELCRQQCRQYDSIVRWGGEEFLVVVPCISAENLLTKAERIRASFENTPIQTNSATPFQVTASFGVVSSHAFSKITADELINHADKAMYKAKDSGRNKVCCAECMSV